MGTDPDLIKKVLSKCDLPLPMEEILALKGTPFDKWPATAQEPWLWQGRTRPARIVRCQWQRAMGLLYLDGKRITPARPLWEFFTETPLGPKQKIAFKTRGVRGNTLDDVNPAHYLLLHPRKRARKAAKAKAISEIIGLMDLANWYPTTLEQLLDKWPEFKSYRKEDLDATIKAVSLS